MIGKLDKEIVAKFKEFQEKTGKHSELYIEDVEFEQKLLKDIHLKEKVETRKNISSNKFIEIGDIDRVTKKYDISKKIKHNLPEKGKYAPKGTILVSRVRPLLGGYTIVDGDTYTFTSGDLNPIVLSDNISVNYIFRIICSPKFETFLKHNQSTGGQKPTITSKLYNFDVPIPKDLNKFYSSYQIQEAIVEFFEYSFKEIDCIRERINKRYAIFERLKKALIPSTFIKDYVKIAFGRYAKEFGVSFNITDVEFYKEKVNSIINSKGGSGEYDKNYINNNSGEYPLYTGSKEIVGYVKSIHKKDVVNIESVSFNKDNDAGSKAFYHTKPYIVGGHHYSLIIKSEYSNKIITKYFYYCMVNIFNENKFYQSKKPVANIGLIKKFTILIPKDLKNYSSLEIQKIIADFIEYTENRLQKEFDRMDRGYSNLERLHKTYLARTFTLIDWEVK